MTRRSRLALATLLVGAILAASAQAAVAGTHPGKRLAAALVAGKKGPGGGPRRLERGIVQFAGGGSIVLRELDGSVVTIAVVPQTLIVVNKQPSTLAEIQVGFVAEVLHFGNGPAVGIKAVGLARQQRDRGAVQSVGPASFVLVTAAGPVTVSVGPTTLILLNGRPVALADLKPGDLVVAVHHGSSPATEVRALGRRAR
jgi:hypothetical protein